jgi:hypothetical protein
MRSRASTEIGAAFGTTSATVSPNSTDRSVFTRQTGLFRGTGATISPELQRRSLFQEVNERISVVIAGFVVRDDRYQLFCECGRFDCVERVEVPTEIYDHARHDGRIYLVRPGHEASGDDRLLAANAGYCVVYAA